MTRLRSIKEDCCCVVAPQAYEFVDTLIMILKKNTRQISFLHVYHHASTFFPVRCCTD